MGPQASSSLPLPLFQQATHWFQRAQASLLGTIPCCQGCSACCIGIFPITRLDALELQRGLDALPSLQRDAIVTRARAQVAALEAAYPDLQSHPTLDGWGDGTIDDMVEHFADMPCPALAPDGTCGVYTFRPITCRTMGIPTESDGMVQGACTVQTSVPIVRLSPTFRTEADLLAEHEAVALSILGRAQPYAGEELLLPYGFLPNPE
ncbi:MAG: YkgJ family cysteine cluster protein [Nitrospira sp.]